MKVFILITNVIVIALTVFLIATAPPEIPFYYGQPWGEGQLANKWELVMLPVLLNALYYVTGRFIKGPFREEPVFMRIANGIGVAQSFLIILILVKTFITVS